MSFPLSLETTYDELMAYKMANIDNSLDKREVTSMIFNATAANSLESVQMLFTMANLTNMLFADTAPREELVRRAAERGMSPSPSTPAIRKGVFNIDVPIGSRFSIENVNYTVLEKIDPLVLGEFTLEAETAGTIGNAYSGTLIPISYISGLSTATLTDILIPGEDEESTEAFRTRYFDSFQAAAFGGNRADYKSKVNSIPGVGGVRIYRAWNGGGTVKLVIVDSQFKPASSILVDNVQEIMDPLSLQGEGIGIAPIDHIVTVVSAGSEIVDVGLTITYESGYSWPDVEQQVKNAIDEYFDSLSEVWASASTYQDDQSDTIVRISQIEFRILTIPGILDITNTTLNGVSSNLTIDKEDIPIRGNVVG